MGRDQKSALVTGGAGFVGSHLVESLIDSGWKVTVLDNLVTGSTANLSHVTSTNLRLHVGSITDVGTLEKQMEGVDVVFHLAALADIVPSINDPLSYFETNVKGTVNVMEAARRNGVRKVLYAASSSCYGVTSELPTTELAPISTQYPYALTKWLGEEIVRHWGRVYGVPWVSLRLFNVYGPRSRTSGAYGAVIGVFLAQKLAAKALTIVGDGEQTRDFTYVADVARAFTLAAESEVEGQVFNVGSGRSYSVNHLANLIGGRRTNIPQRPGEPAVTFADISKIKSWLGWEPRFSFEDGLDQVLSQIELWADAPVWEPESIEVATSDWFKYLGPSQ
jgi:UDP-glucose 4-epimerase